MQILMLSWEYPPYIEGGLGRHVAELAPNLVQQGLTVHLVTPVSEPISREPGETSTSSTQAVGQATVTMEHGVVVHRVFTAPSLPGSDIYVRVTEANAILEAYVRRLPESYGAFSLIHTHDWLTSFTSIALKQAWQIPLVTTIHATERGRGRGHLSGSLQRSIDKAERDLIHESTRVIVCSQYMSRELQSFFSLPAAKIDVVPNGVNLSGLLEVSEEHLNGFKSNYAAPDEQIVFTVSRLVHEKGVHRLIDAAPRILNECPSARFIIAGRGPETDNLQNQARSLGVDHKINFIGFVSDKTRDQLFRVATCAVFPSLYEPFGIVALEAMALGCPVVVSDIGGLSEVVTHKETGITTYPDDPESVAWGVTRALLHPDWRQQHALKAKQWVNEMYNWSRIARLTQGCYRQVMSVHLTG
jgi:glycosyltransferase involved in cell wall biosynthesis